MLASDEVNGTPDETKKAYDGLVSYFGHRQNQECANWVSRRLLSEDGNWPESVGSHCFWRRATRSFESRTRSGHVAVRSAERNQSESPVFSAEVDSGCECVAVMQAAESRQREHPAVDRYG